MLIKWAVKRKKVKKTHNKNRILKLKLWHIIICGPNNKLRTHNTKSLSDPWARFV